MEERLQRFPRSDRRDRLKTNRPHVEITNVTPVPSGRRLTTWELVKNNLGYFLFSTLHVGPFNAVWAFKEYIKETHRSATDAEQSGHKNMMGNLHIPD